MERLRVFLILRFSYLMSTFTYVLMSTFTYVLMDKFCPCFNVGLIGGKLLLAPLRILWNRTVK